MRLTIKPLLILVLAGLMASTASAQIDPAETGHYSLTGLDRTGVIIIAWPERAEREAGAIVSWYGYEPGGPHQMWLVSDVMTDTGDWTLALICSGAHPGLFAECDDAGEVRLRRGGVPGTLWFDWRLPVFGGPGCDPRPQASPLPPVCQGTARLERLTPRVM